MRQDLGSGKYRGNRAETGLRPGKDSMAERIPDENWHLTYCVEETAEKVFEMWCLWVLIKQGNWQRTENREQRTEDRELGMGDGGWGRGCRGEENLKGF